MLVGQRRQAFSRQESEVILPAPGPAEVPVSEAMSDEIPVPPAPALPVLADIDFAEGGNSQRFIASGWSHQEPHFVWGLDQSSDILLPETAGWANVVLELDLFPCLIPPYRTVQRLRIRADNLEIGRADVHGPGPVTIAPPPGLAWGGLRRLSFIHPDGIVPADFPDRTDGRCLSIAIRRLTFHGCRLAPGTASEVSRPANNVPESVGGDISTADLMMQFEGLGGTSQGCEFGLVQRALGAEPLSLLRWSQMTALSLAEALEADFEGVGTPEQTVLDYFEWPTHREYRTQDRRFQMTMHTWVKENEKPFDAMYDMACQRLRFLRDKLLGDLAEPSKIFVFKLGDRPCTSEEIARIFAALRRHGPNTLLDVRIADDTHPTGTVEQIRDGLLIGYISRFNQGPDGAVNNPPALDCWLAICRNAYRFWRRRAEGQADSLVAGTEPQSFSG